MKSHHILMAAAATIVVVAIAGTQLATAGFASVMKPDAASAADDHVTIFNEPGEAMDGFSMRAILQDAEPDIPAPDRALVRRRFLAAAAQLRVSPCNGSAKARYLDQVTIYTRMKIAHLSANRSAGIPHEETPDDLRAKAYLERMLLEDFVTEAEMEAAARDANRALARMVDAKPKAAPAVQLGPTACDRHNDGILLVPMPWEPDVRRRRRS